MIGARLGSYRIVETLGTGGMGTVYRAEVERDAAGGATGETVAVKVIHPHLMAREGFFKRFLREADVGRQVRDANVVRTLDCDQIVVDGVSHSILVMEYVEGQTLRELLDELGRVPEELCRHVGCEIAKALRAIHAAGIVHRDMKPENVLITADHVVKVMDLGVAQVQDEALRLSQTGHFVGSIHYAAPEQFQSARARLDGRADLHALGAVLYELGTGTQPFYDEDTRAVLRRVLEDVPRRCAELNPQLSPFYEELVHVLLAKEPDDRLPSAVEVQAVLEAGEDSAWWKERARSLRVETKRPLRRIRIPRDTSLYGRDAEAERLRSLFAEAKAGNGQVLLVNGEAGIGKTRLVDEIVSLLRHEGEDLDFLFGSYPPGGAATVTGAWTSAYREHFGPEGLREQLEEMLPLTPTLVPAFAALLRGEPPPAGEQALTLPTLQTLFVQVTHALAAKRTVVVMIDDLHFAPSEGLGLFASLALAVPGHRILLVGTARRGLSEEWIADVQRHPQVHRLDLHRLGAKDLVMMLRDAFRSERLAEALAGGIALKSDGNPFFVFEIIRGLREIKALVQRPDGTWDTSELFAGIEVPASVSELVKARIAELAREDRELLEVAACCGFEFDPVLVAEAAELGRLAALKRFGQIEKGDRLVRSAGRRMVFDHHQVQEALYESIAEPLCEAYHAAIGEALERRAGGPPDAGAAVDGAVAVDICEHFLRGAEGRRATPWLDAALQVLEQRLDNDRAVRLAQRALEDSSGAWTGEDRARVLLAKTRCLNVLGRREEEATAIAEARALLRGGGDPDLQTHLLDAEAAFHFARSEYREAGTALDRMLTLAREVGNPVSEGRALALLGALSTRRGDLAAARTYYGRWLEQARRRGDLAGEAAATGGLGTAAHVEGRYDEARGFYERYLTLAREAGDRYGEGVATGNLSTIHRYQGRYDEAHAYVEQRLDLARATGDRRSEGIALVNLGALLLGVGDLEGARMRAEQALPIFDEIDARREEGFVHGLLGGVAQIAGDLEHARSLLEKVVALRRELGDPAGLGDALLTLGQQWLEDGEPETARPFLEEAFALGQSTKVPGVIVPSASVLGLIDPALLDRARALATEHAERLSHSTRMEVDFTLYRATGERTFLEEAHRRLAHLQAHVPAGVTSRRIGIAKHILDAWEAEPA